MPIVGEDLVALVRRAVERIPTLSLSMIDESEAHVGRRTTFTVGVVWVTLEFSDPSTTSTRIDAHSRSVGDLGGGMLELQMVLTSIKEELDSQR